MQLTDSDLFEGITQEEVEQMLRCFCARTERCAAGDTVRALTGIAMATWVSSKAGRFPSSA